MSLGNAGAPRQTASTVCSGLLRQTAQSILGSQQKFLSTVFHLLYRGLALRMLTTKIIRLLAVHRSMGFATWAAISTLIRSGAML